MNMFDFKFFLKRFFTVLLLLSSGYSCFGRNKHVFMKDVDNQNKKLPINRFTKNEKLSKEDTSNLKSISNNSIANVKQNQDEQYTSNQVNEHVDNETGNAVNSDNVNNIHDTSVDNNRIGLTKQTSHDTSNVDNDIHSMDYNKQVNGSIQKEQTLNSNVGINGIGQEHKTYSISGIKPSLLDSRMRNHSKNNLEDNSSVDNKDIGGKPKFKGIHRSRVQSQGPSTSDIDDKVMENKPNEKEHHKFIGGKPKFKGIHRSRVQSQGPSTSDIDDKVMESKPNEKEHHKFIRSKSKSQLVNDEPKRAFGDNLIKPHHRKSLIPVASVRNPVKQSK